MNTSPGTWQQTWLDEDDDSLGWTLDVVGDAQDGELYAEVSGHGPFRWKVGESWETGHVLHEGTADTLTDAQHRAHRAFESSHAPVPSDSAANGRL